MLEYNDYIAAYNSFGSPKASAAKARFFANDCVLESPWGRSEGRDAITATFNQLGGAVREQLRPLHVLYKDNVIMAELDAAFMPYQDLDAGFHHFKKGEAVAFRFFAIYECRGDEFSRVRLACWPTASPVEAF